MTDNDREYVIATVREIARRLDVVKGVIGFELYEGQAHLLRVNGETLYYFNGRTRNGHRAVPCADGIDDVLDFAKERLESRVLKKCGRFGKLVSTVNGDDINPEYVSPLGPRGRR